MAATSTLKDNGDGVSVRKKANDSTEVREWPSWLTRFPVPVILFRNKVCVYISTVGW